MSQILHIYVNFCITYGYRVVGTLCTSLNSMYRQNVHDILRCVHMFIVYRYIDIRAHNQASTNYIRISIRAYRVFV